jgi:hypothetical protein
MKKNLILASVVSLTLMGVAPTIFAADRPNNSAVQLRAENRVDYGQVPGDVKRAIEPQLNSGDKVTDVFKFKRGDRTIYVAYTNDERIIRADDKGNLLSVKGADDETETARQPVKYNTLPGEVKDTLGKEAKGHPMEIWKITRDGKTFYVANIDDADGTRRVRVNSNGDMVDRPVMLSDRGDSRDRNSRIDSRDDRDDIDARRRADRSRYNAEGEKLSFDNLPGDVKRTVGAEMGQDKVTEVLRLKRNGNTVYRVEIEGDTRAKTIWVDDSGKLMRELNDTEEGRVKVNFNELPGSVKSAMINEAHNKEPKRVWQVTRGRETFYVGEADDGHLVRIDSNGKVMSHDSNPKLLSDDTRNRDRDNNTARDRDRDNNARNNNNNERNRNRDNDPNKFEKGRDIDLSNAQTVEFGNLPQSVKDTIREETKRGEKISAIYKLKADNGNTHYVVKTDDGRTIRIGEHGGLLGQTK